MRLAGHPDSCLESQHLGGRERTVWVWASLGYWTVSKNWEMNEWVKKKSKPWGLFIFSCTPFPMFSLKCLFFPYNSPLTLRFQITGMWKLISNLFFRCSMAAGYWPSFRVGFESQVSDLFFCFPSASLQGCTCMFWVWVFTDVLGTNGILRSVDSGVRCSHFLGLCPCAHVSRCPLPLLPWHYILNRPQSFAFDTNTSVCLPISVVLCFFNICFIGSVVDNA